MKPALALAAASVIILGLALWIVWPSRPNEQAKPLMVFGHKSTALPRSIDPPFGFHWGDSIAHVEALLGYSSAEIVMRRATGQAENWTVEGLIQPGLKNAVFMFEKNALTAIELQCQYEAWTADRYRARLEDLRSFFERKYGDQQHGQPVSSGGSGAPAGYSWRLGATSATVLCRFEPAPAGRKLSVSSLVIRYNSGPGPWNNDSAPTPEHWENVVVSPVVARKLQPAGDQGPQGSDFAITNAKLLNTSDSSQTALVLQLAVKLQQEELPDATKTVVEVNFYDTLPNGEIVLTDAEVNYDWQSRRDWKQKNPEMLGVSYIRKQVPSRQNASSPRFFGYVATVYYDGRLETVWAEPLSLINLFPVRTFISPFESAQGAAARGDFVAAARLYRSAADQGNLFALENLAWFYAKGKGVPKNLRQAAVFYERAALQNTPRALNALAWFLATCEDGSIRNGVEAVRQASKSCELTYWQEWKYIDTLAAAWAETGDFKRAVEYEQQALQLPDLDDAARKKIEDRLGLYRKRQPVRD